MSTAPYLNKLLIRLFLIVVLVLFISAAGTYLGKINYGEAQIASSLTATSLPSSFSGGALMKAAYDSVNRVYLVISGGMGWFLDENGAQLGGSFIIAQESPNLTSPFIAWSDVTFGGPLNDPVFLVTYVVGDQVANTKYGRLVRYGANSSVSIGPRSKVTDIFSEWYASEKAQSVWDGQGFIVGTRVLTSGATWAQPQLNHFDMAGNVSGGVIIGDGLDFEGSPALDCSPSGVCLAVGFASGEPYNYHSGGYGRLFDSRSLLPIGSLFYLDDNTGPGQGQDQGVVFNPSTGKFLVAWQNYGDIYTRLVDVDGTLGPIINAFGPDAGDNRIKYNSATSTTLLVTKWSPADLYAVELGDDGMPINTGGAVLLSVWDGVLKRYDPAIASDNISGKWLSLFAVSGGYDGAIVTNQYSGSQLFPPEYYEPTSFNPSNQPFGATQTLPNPPAAMPLGDFIGYIFLYSLYMVGLTVFVMITWAGVLWLTSRGNPSQIALAKHKIYHAIIGAIILVSGFAILYSINPALVQGTIRFPGLKPSATSVQSTSVIIQATCSGGVCSDDNSACTVDTDCNNVCIDNACNNGAPGTCTYDTDCQLLNRAWGTSDVEIASALSSGCFMISGTQEFSSVQCPLGSSILAPDPLVQIQDASANQQVGAITIHSAGNTGLGKRVVVLDTGYNYNHPELQSSYLGGRDFVNNDNDPMDDNGHGSHVAGIITGDGIDPRSRGVAPDAGIIAGKVLASNGGGFGSDIVKGIYWAIDGPDGIYGTSDDFKPDIINISIGSKTKVVRSLCDNSEQIFANAVRYANDHGALVVASSGNEGDGGVTLPGCIDNAITVGAVDGSNNSAYFSGKGMAVDVVAPGVNIYSAGTGNSYTTLSGTSQAAPNVSGIAALIKFANPALAVSELKRILISTVQDLGAAGWDDIFGWGLEMADRKSV